MMKILIAEDESDISKTYQAALESRNHDVTIVGDGLTCIKLYQEAYERSKRVKNHSLDRDSTPKKTEPTATKQNQQKNGPPYDVIVLDYKMPGKNGMEVAKEILRINPEQRIIFASAYVKDTLEESVKQLHRVVELLQKPFSIDAFIDTIEDKDVYEELKKIMVNIREMDRSDTLSDHGNSNVELSREQIRDIFEGLRKIQKNRTF